MNRLTLLIICLLVSCHSNTSKYRDEETVKLKSLESKHVKVEIKYDLVNDKINLQLSPSEKMLVKGFRGLTQEMKVLDDKFIEFRFDMRGGTGVAVGRYVLICVSNGKLCRSIDHISLLRSEFKETYVPEIDSLHLYDESSLYQLDFTGLKETNNSYEIIAKCFMNAHSKIDPTQNFENQDTTQLHFDMHDKVFFTKFENMDGAYLLWSEENLNEQVNFHNEKLPSICINQGSIYIYFRHKWYLKRQDFHLEETDFNL